MSDPIWLDTNVVAAAANGNVHAEQHLVELRRSGRKLLLTPAANNELLYGNPLTMDGNRSVAQQQPSANTRAKIEALKTKLDITVDMEAAKIPASQRVGYAMQDHVKRPRNQALPPSLSNISESDSLVLSQVKAGAEARGVKSPEILTAETGGRGMVSQAGRYGVTAVRLPPPPPPPPLRARIGAGLKASGRSVAFGGVAIALELLAAWLLDKVVQKSIKKDIDAMAPRITQELLTHIGAIANIQSRGSQPFANVTIRIVSGSNMVGSTAPGAELDLVEISDQKIEFSNRKLQTIYSIGSAVHIQRYTYSFEVSVSDEELALFNQLMAKWNEMRANQSMSTIDSWSAEQKLRDEFVQAFGPAVGPEVLDAWVWPTFRKQ